MPRGSLRLPSPEPSGDLPRIPAEAVTRGPMTRGAADVAVGSRSAMHLLLVMLCVLGPLVAQEPPCSAPIDLNQATAKQLEALPGIGRDRAEMIVRVRERNGHYKSVEELWALPRLTKKQFAVLRKCLTVSDPTRAPQPGNVRANAPQPKN